MQQFGASYVSHGSALT